MWFCPGGHIDPNELPHQAVEREFFEESGIRARAESDGLLAKADQHRESVPAPFHTNLHWVCRENYDLRTSDEKFRPHPQWKECEMHFGMSFLMQLEEESEYLQNEEETDGIGWFSKSEADELVTEQMIRDEISFAFSRS